MKFRFFPYVYFIMSVLISILGLIKTFDFPAWSFGVCFGIGLINLIHEIVYHRASKEGLDN